MLFRLNLDPISKELIGKIQKNKGKQKDSKNHIILTKSIKREET